MFGALGITVYCDTQPLIEPVVCPIPIGSDYAVRVLNFGIEQKEISPSPFCYSVDVI